ncbi:MAG: hypothetical protein KIT25_25665 [Enhydrobacter sp.]|nr:MAG: hypothetical protein KIT25_25665 [Enhydrobacter sp.]
MNAPTHIDGLRFVRIPGLVGLSAIFIGSAAGGLAVMTLYFLAAWLPVRSVLADRWSAVRATLAALLTGVLVTYAIGGGLWLVGRPIADRILAAGYEQRSGLILVLLAVTPLWGWAMAAAQRWVLGRWWAVRPPPLFHFVGFPLATLLVAFGGLWLERTENAGVVVLFAAIIGLPLAFTISLSRASGARFPRTAELAGRIVSTGRPVFAAAVFAALAATFLLVHAGTGLADLDPLGEQPTTLASAIMLFVVAFGTFYGAWLGLEERRTPTGEPATAAGHDRTDSLSSLFLSIAPGFVAVLAVFVVMFVADRAGVDLGDAETRGLAVAFVVAALYGAQGRFGRFVDRAILGFFLWGLYALYLAMTLDSVNSALLGAVERLLSRA